MNNLIMGTAGHIDHGKTKLIEALTDINCDTHSEEKRRGITINLGFSKLILSNNLQIGIIDVPGHKDFINTMVAGAFGIDFVLLVIAADSGVMPQTVEHLKIMQLLGIKRGIVVLTKIDLVEREFINEIKSEIKTFLRDTFLNNSDIVEVSSTAQIGIKNLIRSIINLSRKIERKDKARFFRMFIDRVFSIKGFGTVVTGSSLGGTLYSTDHLWLLPDEKRMNSRRIEQYGNEIENISGRCRVSINLTGLKRSDVHKGSSLSQIKIKPTLMVDATFSLFDTDTKIGVWSTVMFILGTYQNIVRMHLIDKDKIVSNQKAIVQIHLKIPAVLMRGDKFIIRDSSSEKTLGGGEIIDAYPLHHKRRPQELINKLYKISSNDTISFVKHEIEKNGFYRDLEYLEKLLNINKKELLDLCLLSKKEDLTVLERNGCYYFLKKSKVENFEKKIVNAIENYHKRNPLNDSGKKIDELITLMKIEHDHNTENIISSILEGLARKKVLKQKNNSWISINHIIKLTTNQKDIIKKIDRFFFECKLHVATSAEIENIRKKLKLSDSKFRQITNYLISEKKLYCFEGKCLHSSYVNKSRLKLLSYLADSEEGITVAKFRDLVGGNRKSCILMLNIFDFEGLTARNGDIRTITIKGEKFINYKEERDLS